MEFKKITKKVIVLCEGFTEPDYVKGLVRNKNELGINSIISFFEIPRLEMDTNETDILRMIKLANDYVDYCRFDKLTTRLFVSMVFETAIDELQENYYRSDIKGNNKELRKLKNEVLSKMEQKGIRDFITEDNRRTAESICASVFSEYFHS